MKVTTLPAGRAHNYDGQADRKDGRKAVSWTKSSGSITEKVKPSLKIEKISDRKVIKVLKPNAKRAGSAAGERYKAMVAYVKKHKKASLAVVMANTSYRMSDYRHDTKKGFIELVKA